VRVVSTEGLIGLKVQGFVNSGQPFAAETLTCRVQADPSGLMMEAKLLGLSPEAIRSGPYVLDVNVAFGVHVAEKFGERGKNFLDVLGLLGLRVCLIDDLDIKIEAVHCLSGQRLSPDDPVIWVNVVNRNGGEVALLVQNTGCVFEQHLGYGPSESGRPSGADLDVQDWHDDLQ
jgi:hypothetical protein